MRTAVWLIVSVCGAISAACAAGLPRDKAGGIAPGKQEIQMGTEDVFSYIENAADERTRSWIRKQNERTRSALESDPRFRRYYQIALDNFDNQGVLTSVAADPLLHDGLVYQTWRDSAHPRGVWRRTPLNLFLAQTPKWETLLDIDALARVEGRPLMFSRPVFSPRRGRCLVGLLHEGIVIEWREFDIERRAFVSGGFRVPPAKASFAAWQDKNTLIVSADWGAGTLDDHGFPMLVKEWHRGQPFETAREILRRGPHDWLVYVVPQDESTGRGRQHHVRTITMKMGVRGWWLLDQEGRLAPMTIPAGVLEPTLYDGHYFFTIPDDADWTIAGKTWKAGTLVAIPGSQITLLAPAVQPVIKPQVGESVLPQSARTAAGMLVLRAHRGRVTVSRIRLVEGQWQVDQVPLAEHGLIRLSMSDFRSGEAFVLYESELQPQTLYQVDVKQNQAVPVATRPARFDANRFVVEELSAISADGVSVPYRLVRDRSMPRDGTAPVLINGYGAAAIPQYPQYNASFGTLWLEQGGVYVAAGVRGGGEYGESWHVRGTDRQHTYDDMLAIARDLIDRRITSPKRIGLFGHSAGGLLAGVMITQQPDLFGAAILFAPVLDNFRLDLLTGGERTFGAEYGSPSDPTARAFLTRTSPFQNLRKGDDFPVPLILTATDDQNVYPAQPRRFAAKMDELGMPFLYHESAEGGHAAAPQGPGRARLEAWMFTYLAQRLIDPYSASADSKRRAH